MEKQYKLLKQHQSSVHFWCYLHVYCYVADDRTEGKHKGGKCQ